MKKETRLSELYAKYKAGTATAAERQVIDGWYNSISSGIGEDVTEQELAEDKQLMWEAISLNTLQANTTPSYKLWYKVVAAAIVLITVSIAIFWYRNANDTAQNIGIANADINPGVHGATLTLASGKKIKLSTAFKGELTRKGELLVTKSADGKLVYEPVESKNQSNETNILSTDKGETYEVRLPDGSKVWLNAASTLTYTVDLMSAGRRLVQLDGEGYFEIAKDKKHPFIVKSRGQEVEVLGTHFNLNTYDDEPVSTTTLLEGSVQITTNKYKKNIRPGEQVINNGTDIQIGSANIDQVVSWKKGDFYLNHVDFKIAMRDIARWYNVEIIYDTSVPNDIEFGGWIARSKPLSAVLKSIQSSGLVKFRLEGRKIYVMK